jgi:hypothetical protein
MSHQATLTDAPNLARAALTGTRGLATPTLTAHFHAMEAKALERERCDCRVPQAGKRFATVAHRIASHRIASQRGRIRLGSI